MGWYTRALAGTFPSYFFRRQKALTYLNAYEAEKATRTFNRKTEPRGPNASTLTAPKALRELVREMEQNYDVVSGALDILCSNIVGSGIEPEPMVLTRGGEPHQEANDFIAEARKRWARRPEVTWSENDSGAQHLLCRTWLRDGAVLTQHILGERSGLQHGSDIPYSYEMIEPDMLVSDPRAFVGRSDVIGGIEINAWRRPIAYHLWKHHPYDFPAHSRTLTAQDRKRVPAEDISHLRWATRINQLHGVTKFHNVIKRIQDIAEIDETERVAARVAAAFAAVIIKGDPGDYAENEPDTETGERELTLRPGIIFDDLQPGEKVESIGSNRPNNELIPFRGAQLRAGAAGIGVSYSSWSKDYNGTYSSQRQELVEQRQLYTPLWAKFVGGMEQPKHENFVKALILSGWRVPRDVDPATLFDAIYTQPALPWIQPVQEAEGWKRLIDMGVETRAGVIRARGRNPRDIERQRKLENEKDSEPGMVPDQGGQPPKPGGSNLRGNRVGGIR